MDGWADQKRGADRAELLAKALRVFSDAAQDVQRGFQQIAQFCAELLGDLAAIRLLSADGTRFEAPVGIWDRDPRCRELLEQTPAVAASQAVGPELLRTGRPVVISNSDHREVAARIGPPERRGVIEELGIHSIVIMPLRAGDQVVGIISVARRQSGTPAAFSDEDLGLLEELALRAALFVSHLRALTESVRLREQLQSAIDARDEFLWTASHELRTPLAALLLQLSGLGRALERDGLSAGRSRQRVDTAIRQGDRLASLIDGMLDVARISTDPPTLDPRPFDLRALVTEVLDRLEEQSRHAGSTITVSAEHPAVGAWDRPKLAQAITQIVGNAVKFGLGRPIAVTVAVAGDRARVAVADQGIGIATADQSRIFERFERAVPSNHYAGLGVGLFLADQIVKAHGGGIELTSAPGAGACFTVVLPLGSPETGTFKLPPK